MFQIMNETYLHTRIKFLYLKFKFNWFFYLASATTLKSRKGLCQPSSKEAREEKRRGGSPHPRAAWGSRKTAHPPPQTPAPKVKNLLCLPFIYLVAVASDGKPVSGQSPGLRGCVPLSGP